MILLGPVRMIARILSDFAPTFLPQTLISDVFEFLVVLSPLTCSLCLVNSILTASVTKTVDKSESGAMLGLNMAVHSIIRYIKGDPSA